jgi:hypothetical protein
MTTTHTIACRGCSRRGFMGSIPEKPWFCPFCRDKSLAEAVRAAVVQWSKLIDASNTGPRRERLALTAWDSIRELVEEAGR